MTFYDLLTELSSSFRVEALECQLTCRGGECEEYVNIQHSDEVSTFEEIIIDALEAAEWCTEKGVCEHCKANAEAEMAEWQAEERGEC